MKDNSIILILLTVLINTQNIVGQANVSGKVTDPNGNPLENVSIEIIGKSIRSTTNNEGLYIIAAQPGDELEFSFIGLESVKQKVHTSGPLNVTMHAGESQNMEEIQVIALAHDKKKKEAITGSVSTVNKKLLQQIQTPDVLKSLEGSVAGLQITQGSGQPGSSIAMATIRGIGSINAGTEPLIVVDGAPYSGDLNAINSADIEQISILKDAASTALYGHRGGNGAIVITTKRGKKNHLSISLDSRIGFNHRMLPQYDIITDPKEYYEAYWMVKRNGHILNSNKTKEVAGQMASDSLIKELGYNIYDVPDKILIDPKTGRLNPNAKLRYKDDWDAELFKNKVRQEHFLSIYGGSANSRYSFSLSKLKDGGIITNSNFDRLTTRVSIDQDLRDWFQLGGTFSYANTIKRVSRELTGKGNAFSWTREIPPIYPIYARDAQGNFIHDENGNKKYDWGKGETVNADGAPAKNPAFGNFNTIGLYNMDWERRTKDNFWGNFYTKVEFLKDFEWNYSYTAALTNYNCTTFENPTAGDMIVDGGEMSTYSSRALTQNHQALLKWNKKWQDHKLSALIGGEEQHYAHSFLLGTKGRFLLPEIHTLDFAGESRRLENYERDYKTRNFLSSINYDYLSKYYLSGGFSRGASSVFHKDKRWGNFYGLGAAWRISQEPFMATTKNWLNELKIKISYGQKGNDAIMYGHLMYGRNYYAYKTQYKPTSSVSGGKEVQLSLLEVGNPDLNWEKRKDLNFGLEFSLFNKRLTGSIEHYINTTSDLLYNNPTPPSTGKSHIPTNIGRLKNRGIDIELGIGVIRTPNIDWNLSLTLSHFKNKILELEPSTKGGVITKKHYKLTEGRSTKDYYMRSFAGVDNNTGKALYWKDEIQGGEETGNRIRTTNYDEATRYFQNKTALPDVYGGLQSFLRIKNFDFSVGISYSIGGYAIDEAYKKTIGLRRTVNNFHRDALNSWTVDNKDSGSPVIATNYTDGTKYSDRFLIDASWFSISNISIGYNLNQDWIKSYGISALRIYAIVNNVYLWSAQKGFDPRLVTGSAYYKTDEERWYTEDADTAFDQTSLYPAIRTFSIGMKLDF